MWRKVKKFFSALGPGLVTGASDDDPSGIATYSQAGAKYGLATLWTVIITFPLMAAIQEMCARIGLVTSVGLTTTLKKHYPRPVLYLMILFSVPAIILNIGADIASMGAVANLLFPSVAPIWFSLVFTALLLIVIIFLPYAKFVNVLKYLCLVLLLYIIVPFLTRPDWSEVLHHLFLPRITADREQIGMLVAILGTTISPYLFFWQTNMVAEDVKVIRKQVMVNKRMIIVAGNEADPRAREKRVMGLLLQKMGLDVNLGMLLSNVIMFFIILTAGTALFPKGVRNIETVEQAAQALRPVAGDLSYLLFAAGVIGTGALAIPVLGGCLSYIVSEALGWKGDLDKKFDRAKGFYGVIIVALLLGLLINYLGISPVQALLYTALLYGVTSPVIIAIILHLANNKKIMGEHTNSRWSNFLGGITLILMTLSAVLLVYFQFFNRS